MEKILLIEDNFEIRENISEILLLENYLVLKSECGESALQLLKTEQPDLILCDIGLPGIDGFGVFSKIKELVRFNLIPFIFLTGSTCTTHKCKGLDIGADDFIMKPFIDSELLSIIKCRIKKSRLLRDSLTLERKSYVKELEDIIFHISHSVRSPLCSSLGLAKLLDNNKGIPLTNMELKKVIDGIKSSNIKMHGNTEELTQQVSRFLLKYKKEEKL